MAIQIDLHILIGIKLSWHMKLHLMAVPITIDLASMMKHFTAREAYHFQTKRVVLAYVVRIDCLVCLNIRQFQTWVASPFLFDNLLN